MPDFMDAVQIMYESYPALLDAGFNGYGSWSIYSPQPTGEGTPPTLTNYTTTFLHTIANFGKTTAEAQQLFGSTMAKLGKYNGTSLFFANDFYSSPDYADYYSRFSGIVTPVGQTAALGSRLLDNKALTGSPSALKTAITAIAGELEQATSNNLILMGGKGSQIFKDAQDRNSGVLPAWRSMYVHNVVARGWLPGSDDATINAVYDDITNTKVKALKTLAPNMGSYMNEVSHFCSLPTLVFVWMKEAYRPNRVIATTRTTLRTSMARMLKSSLPSSRNTILTACSTAQRASVAMTGQCKEAGSCARTCDGSCNGMR